MREKEGRKRGRGEGEGGRGKEGGVRRRREIGSRRMEKREKWDSK